MRELARPDSDDAAAALRRPGPLPMPWSGILLTVVMPTYNAAENLTKRAGR
ncbi:hypothetical protein [Streptomyces sp. NPDC048527]|uniref:hypothetical protein n=1 Tax=Streptomyces sp. NPDC048527 TaxID=3365568 RepID=UPI00371FA71E